MQFLIQQPKLTDDSQNLQNSINIYKRRAHWCKHLSKIERRNKLHSCHSQRHCPRIKKNKYHEDTANRKPRVVIHVRSSRIREARFRDEISGTRKDSFETASPEQNTWFRREAPQTRS